jgi:hypothetical protein
VEQRRDGDCGCRTIVGEGMHAPPNTMMVERIPQSRSRNSVLDGEQRAWRTVPGCRLAHMSFIHFRRGTIRAGCIFSRNAPRKLPQDQRPRVISRTVYLEPSLRAPVGGGGTYDTGLLREMALRKSLLLRSREL